MAQHDLSAGNFILIQPGNKKTMRRGKRDRQSNIKYWPEDRWTAVCQSLLDEYPQDHLVMCGTAEERVLMTEIMQSLSTSDNARNRVLNAAGDLPIPRLLALAQQARGMISVDTGPAHAAAAVGCPLLVLFGATDPRCFTPRGSAVVRVVHSSPDLPYQSGAEWWAAHHSMMDLSPAEVIHAWRDIMSSVAAS